MGEILAILGFFMFMMVAVTILMEILWHEPSENSDSADDTGFGL